MLIGGEAGQGMMSIENRLNETLSRLNYHFFATKNYMSRIRGGHNFHMFRVADHPVNALVGAVWDIVIALDQETERRHGADLRPGGFLLSHAQVGEIERRAREAFGSAPAANSVIVGLLLAAIGVPLASIEAKDAADRLALDEGYAVAERWGVAGRFVVAAKASADHLRFDGNQALGLGAILGGCQFMASYPMTPATSIMVHFSQAAQHLPIHFEQAEDEIAAINMAIGASYAGLRAMVATSGGGFALMPEAVSLAGMTETPVVVIVAQRPGPSTGLPTRTEQGDLNFILHAGHGEFPRILLAPGSIDEAIDLARRSFELADAIQGPVFILTDQYLADSVQILEEPVGTLIGCREVTAYGSDYRRYRLTPDGVSPLTFPGIGEALVCVDSDEHDEEGRITEDLELRVRMVDKRLAKEATARRYVLAPQAFGDMQADTVLICWGSNKLIVKEAVDRLNQEGVRIGGLHFRQLYPLIPEMIEGLGLGRKRLIGIENNATGQFANLLKQELGLTVGDRILKYDGTCFTVDEICKKIEAVKLRGQDVGQKN